MPDVGHARWLSDRSTVMPGKARKRIGYRSRFGLKDGMEATASFFRDRMPK